jgi:hypothetical protein
MFHMNVLKRLAPYILSGATALLTVYCYYSILGLLTGSAAFYPWIAVVKGLFGDSAVIVETFLEIIVATIGAGLIALGLLSLLSKGGHRMPALFYSCCFLGSILAMRFYWSSSSYQEFEIPTQVKLLALELLELLPLLLIPIVLISRRNGKLKV